MMRALFVGDSDYSLFQPAVRWLSEHGQLRCKRSASAAVDACRRRTPDLVVVGHVRPGQFVPAEIEQLHGAAPLARLVALLGGWCDGTTRLGTPVGLTPVYWHQFVARAPRELFTSISATWTLPRTSTDAERLMASRLPTTSGNGLVIVRSTDHLSFEIISDALLSAGFAAARVTRNESFQAAGAVAGIWDCARAVREDRQPLLRFVERLKPARVIATVGFPRGRDARDARDCGVSVVVGKPFLNDDLFTELSTVTDHRRVA